MGNTFVVAYWNWEAKQHIEFWRGESLFGAVRAMLRCKLNGWKSMTLTWRPIDR